MKKQKNILSLVNPIDLTQFPGIDSLYHDKDNNLYWIHVTNQGRSVSDMVFIPGLVNLQCQNFGDHYIVKVVCNGKEEFECLFGHMGGPKALRPWQINCIEAGVLLMPKSELSFLALYREILSRLELKETSDMTASFYRFSGLLKLPNGA